MNELDELKDELAAIVGTAEPSNLDPQVDWFFVQANTKHSEFKSALHSAIYAARDSGKLLLQAKAAYQKAYGKRADWTGTLKREFDGSLQTAYNHMKIADPENWQKIEAYFQRLESSEREIGVNEALRLLSAAEESDVVDGEIVEESPETPLEKGKSELESEKCGRLSNPNSHDEHYTPQPIIERVQAVLGVIELDPCSNSHEKPWVPAKRHYTKDDDGLFQGWVAESVYVNPPYSNLLPWAEKLNQELTHSKLEEALVLVPAYTDTQWWDVLCKPGPMLCFFHGRLTFEGNRSAARFPSAMFYFGQDSELFYQEFASLGRIFQEIGR